MEDSGGEPARERCPGPAAEAVVLIPSWQAEEKCEGFYTEEAVHHCEVLCILSVKRAGSDGGWGGGRVLP